MKWSRLLILVFAAWAGTMYYRYHAVAKLFIDSANTPAGSSQSSQNLGGGIGKVGGIGPVGNSRGFGKSR